MPIREATESDADPIAALLGELGYPSAPTAIPARLARLSRGSASLVVLAEEQGQVVGLATGRAFPALHTDALIAYLTSVVVSSASRKRGVGRELVHHVEEWARNLGAAHLTLVTGIGVRRADAHAFYERLGYERTGHRYVIRLREPS